ncbi:hypothetical protein My1_073 [Pectobacterium phage My1]|uniref:Uncharacterized protein n=1 Tax=Pectobacterium phage My1 TaxID=1204539 RepID=J9QNW8_9CAUD|nr:hypothetical protein My1_073 [Pectobacterium phage My1]AFQ22232.1 hypothetical protein My1_073 [Pectobacterium phage My1]
MTKNDAYLYAKKIYRQNLSNKQVEDKMLKELYTYSDITLVKNWLSSWTHGRTM